MRRGELSYHYQEKQDKREELSPLVEKFLSRKGEYRTHEERAKLVEEDRKLDALLEKISHNERLFTRYLRIFSDYRGEVKFLDEYLLKLDVEPYISLPKNYALKGGAARVSIERALDKTCSQEPRDIDICYIGDPHKEDLSLSESLAERYMPDDYAHGYGVEPLEDNYFESRDFTINEVLVNNDGAILTKQALLDIMRSIIRFTEYEKTNFYYQDFYDEEEEVDVRFVNDKLASKALRLIAERDSRIFVDDDFFRKKYISEFHMALHLDRAMGRGFKVAKNFVENLKKYHQIPEHINSPLECAAYLEEYTDFIYRHLESFRDKESLLSHNNRIREFEEMYLDTLGGYAITDLKYDHIVNFFDDVENRKYKMR